MLEGLSRSEEICQKLRQRLDKLHGPFPATDTGVEIRILKKQIDSAFQARIDPELCSNCEACRERCQMGAIKEGEQYKVDPDRCIGCGLCVSTCPTEAITMLRKAGPATPPGNRMEMAATILKERGIIK